MSGSIRLAVGFCLAASLFHGACARESSEAKSAQSTEAGKASEEREQAQVAETPKQPGGAQSSAEAYQAIIAEIEAFQQTGASQGQVVAKIEDLFKGFIADYPGTEEAADAQLNLGGMYAQLGRTKESIAILYELIDSGTASTEKVGMAHFFLGEAYKASDQFDSAKRELTLVVEKYSFLNQRIVMSARASLEELDALKLLSIGSKPIPFQVKGTDGQALSLEKYKGKVVLLDFWATWCGPCRADMPSVVSLYKKHRNSGFEIIGVSLDKSREAFDRYVKTSDMQWPQYFDGKYWENDIAMLYKIRSIPATFLIDRKGVLRYRAVRGRQLEQAVDELLKETS